MCECMRSALKGSSILIVQIDMQHQSTDQNNNITKRRPSTILLFVLTHFFQLVFSSLYLFFHFFASLFFSNFLPFERMKDSIFITEKVILKPKSVLLSSHNKLSTPFLINFASNRELMNQKPIKLTNIFEQQTLFNALFHRVAFVWLLSQW